MPRFPFEMHRSGGFPSRVGATRAVGRPAWSGPGAILGCILCLALLMPSTSPGARFVALTIEQLAMAAELVVHGTVESLESRCDGSGRIFTRIGVDIVETWKGQVAGGGRKLEAVAGGGVLGDRAVRVAGQAVYAVGDEVVAYLVRNEAGEWVTLGLGQGRFEVTRDAGDGRKWVSNPVWGRPHGESGTPGGAVAAAGRVGILSPMQRPIALEELRRRTLEVAP